FWPRHFFSFIPFGEFLKALFEHLAVGNDFTLFRDAGSDLTATRPLLKIVIRNCFRSEFYRSLDMNLPFQFSPIKSEDRLRICSQIASLFAAIIGEENEPILIDMSQ